MIQMNYLQNRNRFRQKNKLMAAKGKGRGLDKLGVWD